MIKRYIYFFVIVIAAASIAGCAYFNTFYNANLFFDEAENLREESSDKYLSRSIIEKYRDVVEKCDIVLAKYPKSRYIDDAYLLKGKSNYYIGNYDEAENNFNSLIAINSEKYSNVAEYWIALIKWKNGKSQPALNDLDRLSSNTKDEKQLAKIYESIANIYLDIDQDDDAIRSLQRAAEITKNSIDKGNIYYELALLADKIGNYKNAIINYENAIKYSYSPDRISESHLRIVQLHRDLGQLEEASSQISDMLNKPSFQSIYADLNLELAKLEFAVNNNEEGVKLLDDIVVNFPKTEVSAESFYLLGNEYLFNLRDFSKADYYYQQIKVEFINSEYKEAADLRLNEINQYNLSKDNLISLTSNTSASDSLELAIDTTQIAQELYNLGELEAFHFNKLDTALVYFNKIINEYPRSDIEPKVLYTLSVINQDIGDSSKSLQYEKQIISDYPNSEFADYIRTTTQNADYGKSSLESLHEAEQLYLIDKELALAEYKNIINNSSSEASARAILFLANDYENRLFLADSSKKYYELVIEKYPDSKQAKFAQNKLDELDLITEESVE